MFDVAVNRAMQTDEIELALNQLAQGDEMTIAQLQDSLKAHVSAQRKIVEPLVAEEAEKYTVAKSRFLTVRNDVLATTETGRQAIDARESTADSAERLDASTAELDRLREKRAMVLRDLDNAESVEASKSSSTADRSSSYSTISGMVARIDTWRSSFGLQWIPAISQRAAANRRVQVERELEEAQCENEALRREVARAWNMSVAAEQRAAAAAEPLLSQDPGLQASYDAVKVAEEVLERAIREKAALPEMRRWINDLLVRNDQRLNRTFFDTGDTSGLAQMAAPEHEIPTKAFHELEELLKQMGGGSVGVSGPRGSGKSTLIRSWSLSSNRNSPNVIGVVVPAPVEYEPREFLLHLFAELCKRVVPGVTAEIPTPSEDTSRRTLQMVRAVGAALTISGAVLVARTLAAGAPQSTLIASFLLVVCALGLMVYNSIGTRSRQPGSIRYESFFVARMNIRSCTELEGWVFVILLVASIAYVSNLAVRRAELLGVIGVRGPGLVILGACGVLFVTYTFAVLNRTSLQRSNRLTTHKALVVPRKVLPLVCAITGAALIATLPLASASIQPGLRQAAAVLLIGGSCGTLLAAIAAGNSFASERYAFSAASSIVSLVSVVVGMGVAVSALWFLNLGDQIVWGSVLVGVGAALLLHNPPSPVKSLDHESEHSDSLDKSVRMTAEAFRRIRFLQTTTRGWSSALKLGSVAGSPLTAEQSTAGGVSLAQTPVTYPDLVSDFHDYVKALTNAESVVIIGIDELDKLSADAADRFMNGIKAVFDGAVRNCYYLVSISEEALASFEQRGLLARNVFDTAFDAMIKVEYLTLEGTIALLDRRLIDVPRGVAALCHTLSGGLARDVIRFMRLMVRMRGDRQSVSLDDLAAAVCARELGDRLDGLVTASRSLKDWQDVRDLTAWARALDIDDVASMNDVPPRLLNADGGADRAAALDLLRLHCCSFYQLATIKQFFAVATSDRIQKAVLSSDASSFQRLAHARNEIGANVAFAWQEISDFRTACGLSELEGSFGVELTTRD